LPLGEGRSAIWLNSTREVRHPHTALIRECCPQRHRRSRTRCSTYIFMQNLKKLRHFQYRLPTSRRNRGGNRSIWSGVVTVTERSGFARRRGPPAKESPPSRPVGPPSESGESAIARSGNGPWKRSAPSMMPARLRICEIVPELYKLPKMQGHRLRPACLLNACVSAYASGLSSLAGRSGACLLRAHAKRKQPIAVRTFGRSSLTDPVRNRWFDPADASRPETLLRVDRSAWTDHFQLRAWSEKRYARDEP